MCVCVSRVTPVQLPSLMHVQINSQESSGVAIAMVGKQEAGRTPIWFHYMLHVDARLRAMDESVVVQNGGISISQVSGLLDLYVCV